MAPTEKEAESTVCCGMRARADPRAVCVCVRARARARARARVCVLCVCVCVCCVACRACTANTTQRAQALGHTPIPLLAHTSHSATR